MSGRENGDLLTIDTHVSESAFFRQACITKVLLKIKVRSMIGLVMIFSKARWTVSRNVEHNPLSNTQILILIGDKRFANAIREVRDKAKGVLATYST